MNEIDNLLNQWEAQFPLISDKYKGVIVSCSGGPDSTALFHLIDHFLKDKKKFSLAIYHMNFGLRSKESDEDQQFLEKLAEKTHTPIFCTKPCPVPTKKANQAWARSERIKGLMPFVDKGWMIALAHQRDEMAENVLLRLARGSGPSSLAGMSMWNPPFWRPLLALSKASLVSWMEIHNIKYRSDSSNKTLKYSRNVIRHKVIPTLESLYPGAMHRIVECAQDSLGLADHIKTTFKEEISSCYDKGTELKKIQGLNDSVLREILSCMIGRSIGSKQITRTHLNLIIESIRNNKKIAMDLPQGKKIFTYKGRLFVRVD